MKKIFVLNFAVIPLILLTGCSTIQKAKKADRLAFQVSSLKQELKQEREDTERKIKRLLRQKEKEARDLLNKKNLEINRLLSTKDKHIKKIENNKEAEISALEQARKDLANRLKTELKEYKARLEMTERGLVITFLAEIFFASGKDIIRTDAKPTLKKVAEVLNDKISESCVAVEGYTDNVPIHYSGWKSNWELSAARALAVVHYFIDEAQVEPSRLSAIGYGEYRPVTSNDTPEGNQQNRRVEIVILPAKTEKIKSGIPNHTNLAEDM